MDHLGVVVVSTCEAPVQMSAYGRSCPDRPCPTKSNFLPFLTDERSHSGLEYIGVKLILSKEGLNLFKRQVGTTVIFLCP